MHLLLNLLVTSSIHFEIPLDVPQTWGGAPPTIYLNRNGAIVTPGPMSNSASNHSPLVPQPVAIPPFTWGDAAWSQFVGCVRTQFAPFNVTIADIDPGVEHIEAIVGGSPAAIGQPPSVAGFAASYCGVVDTNGVEFVFPDAIPFGDVQMLCEVAAQEIAHAYGLDHEMLCSDPMSYCTSASPKTFQNIDAACGEDFARPCRCGGNTQNSHRALLETMGPSNTTDDERDPPPMREPMPAQPGPAFNCSTGNPSGFASLALVACLASCRRRKWAGRGKATTKIAHL